MDTFLHSKALFGLKKHLNAKYHRAVVPAHKVKRQKSKKTPILNINAAGLPKKVVVFHDNKFENIAATWFFWLVGVRVN